MRPLRGWMGAVPGWAVPSAVTAVSGQRTRGGGKRRACADTGGDRYAGPASGGCPPSVTALVGLPAAGCLRSFVGLPYQKRAAGVGSGN